MDARYIDAERKLAAALGWTETHYNGPAADSHWRAVGYAPAAATYSSIPAWARCSEDCLHLIVEHRCFVTEDVTAHGQAVMVARWSDAHGFGERIAIPIAEHAGAVAAFRYAAVLGVTTKVEAEARARAMVDLLTAA